MLGVRSGAQGGGAGQFFLVLGHRAGVHELVEPGEIGVGPDALGVRCGDAGVGRADIGRRQALLGGLGFECGLGGFDAGLGIGQIGRGGTDARVELLRIERDQRVAALYGLVVRDEDMGDEAAHPRRDQRAVRLDIGGVGGDGGFWQGDVDRSHGRHGQRHADRDDGAT